MGPASPPVMRLAPSARELRPQAAVHCGADGAGRRRRGPLCPELQAVLEALDRAIADEQQLPGGYAAESESVVSPPGEGSNVVDVDFDPA